MLLLITLCPKQSWRHLCQKFTHHFVLSHFIFIKEFLTFSLLYVFWSFLSHPGSQLCFSQFRQLCSCRGGWGNVNKNWGGEGLRHQITVLFLFVCLGWGAWLGGGGGGADGLLLLSNFTTLYFAKHLHRLPQALPRPFFNQVKITWIKQRLSKVLAQWLKLTANWPVGLSDVTWSSILQTRTRLKLRAPCWSINWGCCGTPTQFQDIKGLCDKFPPPPPPHPYPPSPIPNKPYGFCGR